MTDDLQAAQNPAETDTCLRRDYEHRSPHAVFPAVAVPPPDIFAGLALGGFSLFTPGNPPAPAFDDPALFSIQNRPPPAV
jgi:hypothetical protein